MARIHNLKMVHHTLSKFCNMVALEKDRQKQIKHQLGLGIDDALHHITQLAIGHLCNQLLQRQGTECTFLVIWGQVENKDILPV